MSYSNKEKQKHHERQYYLQHREAIIQRQKEYYYTNHEECLLALRKHYSENKEVMHKRNKENYNKHKEARNEYSRTYAKAHREELTKTGNKNRRKKKINVLSYYSNGTLKCECCGELDVRLLTLDHINGGGHAQLKEQGVTNVLALFKNGYRPEGYRVLCFNCNCGRAYNNGVCPHKDRYPLNSIDYIEDNGG